MNLCVADKPEPSRLQAAVGAIPVVGDLVRTADAQAQWMQELVEQNARLLAQLPATMKTFNDSLERFNQTIARLDKAVTRLEKTTKNLSGPIDALRREATRAAADTQKQLALLQTTVERVITAASELPGAGILRRFARVPDGDRPGR